MHPIRIAAVSLVTPCVVSTEVQAAGRIAGPCGATGPILSRGGMNLVTPNASGLSLKVLTPAP